MLKKLRRKFVAVIMAIVAVMLLVICTMIYQFTAANLERESRTQLQSLTQAAMQPGPPVAHREEMRLPYITLQISPWGQVSVAGSSYYDLTDTEFLEELLAEVYSSDEIFGVISRYNLRYCRAPSMGGQSVAFVDISSQRATLSMLVRICTLVGAVSLGMFFGISILLARWAVKPVEKAWQQQRQFVSDASHELKTPLTVIISNAELLNNEDCDEQSRGRFTQNILTMSAQMRKLVEGLLELARADNGQVKKSIAPLELSRLTTDALLPFEPIFFEQARLLESQIEPDIRVNGSEQHLRQVVDILLDNALKYSVPGVIRVELRKQGRGQCLLTVANPGQPIPAAEKDRIFERFYRTDKARSEKGSFGLGLAIAKSVVLEHGGKIWVQTNQTGNCFCVELPIV